MSEKPENDALTKIEEAQAALRASIEKSKVLVEESERLVREHRELTAKPENPAA